LWALVASVPSVVSPAAQVALLRPGCWPHYALLLCQCLGLENVIQSIANKMKEQDGEKPCRKIFTAA